MKKEDCIRKQRRKEEKDEIKEGMEEEKERMNKGR